VAPGQQEIDLRYADALSMADNLMTFRHVIKEVAIAHGAHATFMPKPFRHQPGSGMHTHLSLFEGDQNAFHDPTDPLNLSKTARAFIAYLAFAIILGAGMKGIEEGYELPPGAEDDVWSLSDVERRALGYDELPHNLADALRVMEDSELAAEVLGEHVFDFFLRNKR